MQRRGRLLSPRQLPDKEHGLLAVNKLEREAQLWSQFWEPWEDTDLSLYAKGHVSGSLL